MKEVEFFNEKSKVKMLQKTVFQILCEDLFLEIHELSVRLCKVAVNILMVI